MKALWRRSSHARPKGDFMRLSATRRNQVFCSDLVAYDHELVQAVTPNLKKAGGTMFIYLHKPSGALLAGDAGLGVVTDHAARTGQDTDERRPQLSQTDLAMLRYLRDHLKPGQILHIFLTHGHLDHIGGVLLLMREFKVKLYGTEMTLAMLRRAFQKRDAEGNVTIPDFDFTVIGETGRIECGPFTLDYFPTVHSIPETRSFVLRTIDGWKGLHMAEFRLAECSLDPGVRAAMFDGIRRGAADGPYEVVFYDALRKERGYSKSEDVIRRPLELVLEHPDFSEEKEGALLLPHISSKVFNIAIAQEIANAHGCILHPAGKSMEDMVAYGRKRRWVAEQAPPGGRDRRYRRLIIPCTGSQNEPGAALPRAIEGTARKLSIMPNDWVMLIQGVIPHYREGVREMLVNLTRRCARLVIGRGDARFLGFKETDSKILIIDTLLGERFETTSGHGRLADQHDVMQAAPCIGDQYIGYQSEDDVPMEAVNERPNSEKDNGDHPPVRRGAAILADVRSQLLQIYEAS